MMKTNFLQFWKSVLSIKPLQNDQCQGVWQGNNHERIAFESGNHIQMQQLMYSPLRSTGRTLPTCPLIKPTFGKPSVMFGIGHIQYANPEEYD